MQFSKPKYVTYDTQFMRALCRLVLKEFGANGRVFDGHVENWKNQTQVYTLHVILKYFSNRKELL